jgi:hypothetical protein
MTSEAKLAANRLNARKSRGPKTVEGKARSSANAITHGLTARHFVAKGENAADFERLAQDVLAQFSPRNELERQQIDRLIELLWKSKRARLLETAVLSNSNARDSNDFLQFSFTDNCDTKLPIPERYKQELRVSDVFKFIERVDAQKDRAWREIRRLVDDLMSNRVLQDKMIDGQAEEIAAEPISESN